MPTSLCAAVDQAVVGGFAATPVGQLIGGAAAAEIPRRPTREAPVAVPQPRDGPLHHGLDVTPEGSAKN
ncbi:MAG: hypothetical protein RQ847_03850 [Wenzhouxiangellaceae bacterium]|nr:hypothetical protein [Wenzhouxiangellaceae bacterium]